MLALRAVAGTGEDFRCGKPTTKGAAGYDLTRLLIGSEGTLAIITEATLKLTPLPARHAHAARDVCRCRSPPLPPSRASWRSRRRRARLNSSMANRCGSRARTRGDAVPEAGAMLLIEADGEDAALDAAIDAVSRAARGDGAARSRRRAPMRPTYRNLWAARKALSPALRTLSPKKINEDVVVPVSRIPELVAAMRELSQRHALPIVCFGHAGSGNIHVNLLPRDDAELARADACLRDVFDVVIRLDGTLSGEHGIGLAKRDFMPLAVDANALALMRRIKAEFDPDGILNPGKLLPEQTRP